MKRCAALALTLTLLTPAHAQHDWQRQPVPFYDTSHLLQGLYGAWGVQKTKAFVDAAHALPLALHAHCTAQPAQAKHTLEGARQEWAGVTLSWDTLSAVAIGPLIERRSLRQIDTAPARPALIARAITTQPQGAKAFERVGTPAKGLPALEWLLATEPVQPGTPACNYAVEVALDVEREAQALTTAFAEMASTDWAAEENQERGTAAITEFINQWIGGMERLRWANMEKPLRAAESSDMVPAWPLAVKHWPRAASSLTVESWEAQWSALHRLTVLSKGQKIPTPGRHMVPLEIYLRGRGLNPLADQLVQAAQTADSAFAALKKAIAQSSKNTGTHVMQFARALSALKRLGEAEIAPALQITIGFSDADGD